MVYIDQPVNMIVDRSANEYIVSAVGPRRRAPSVPVVPSLHLAQGSEARAKLFRKELRLFPGRKVPAFVEFVVIDELGIRSLGPTARGLIELVRKGAHGHRDRDPFGGEKGQLAFPIETSR